MILWYQIISVMDQTNLKMIAYMKSLYGSLHKFIKANFFFSCHIVYSYLTLLYILDLNVINFYSMNSGINVDSLVFAVLHIYTLKSWIKFCFKRWLVLSSFYHMAHIEIRLSLAFNSFTKFLTKKEIFINNKN